MTERTIKFIKIIDGFFLLPIISFIIFNTLPFFHFYEEYFKKYGIIIIINKKQRIFPLVLCVISFILALVLIISECSTNCRTGHTLRKILRNSNIILCCVIFFVNLFISPYIVLYSIIGSGVLFCASLKLEKDYKREMEQENLVNVQPLYTNQLEYQPQYQPPVTGPQQETPSMNQQIQPQV